ncbi:hypothetical protein STEG23_037600, partial [Scotinomys teguina]
LFQKKKELRKVNEASDPCPPLAIWFCHVREGRGNETYANLHNPAYSCDLTSAPWILSSEPSHTPLSLSPVGTLTCCSDRSGPNDTALFQVLQ